MNKNINDYIINAINSKIMLEFSYKNYLRTVSPHMFGISTNEKGKKLMKSFQTKGDSVSGGKLPFWRTYDVKKIKNIRVTEERFDIEKDFNPNPEANNIKEVIATVKESHAI